VRDKLETAIYVILGCDTDPDRDYFVKDVSPDSLSWRGMLEGIPRAKDKLQKLTDSDGKPPVFTWNLRVDHQIKQIYGAYNRILTAHTDFLLGLEKTGDELSWHPHFWCYDEKRKVWYQNYQDVDWQVEMLKKAFAAYQEVLPGRARTVRTGWSYHNNRTFATLDKLGVEVDISGIPGLRILPKKKQVRLSNFYDWSITPDKPFYPSAVDYRREAKETERRYSLLEAPNFTAKSFFWGMLSGLVLARKMRDMRQMGYALLRPAYMSTITSKPVLFRPMLAQMKKNLRVDAKVIYSSLLHADELVENIHPVYSLKNIERNLRSILELADNMHAKVKYIRACQTKDYL
jgi:hypothetical protein